jgi:hypothetical protein
MLMGALIGSGLVFAANMHLPLRRQPSGLAPCAGPVGSPLEHEVVSIALSHESGCDSSRQQRGAHPRRRWQRLAVHIHQHDGRNGTMTEFSFVVPFVSFVSNVTRSSIGADGTGEEYGVPHPRIRVPSGR